MKRRTLLVGSLGVLAMPALAKAYFDTGTFNNVAVSGYDPVAYFTQGKAVRAIKNTAPVIKKQSSVFLRRHIWTPSLRSLKSMRRNTADIVPMPWQTVIPPARIPRLFQWSTTSCI